jgi:hypothetical protein
MKEVEEKFGDAMMNAYLGALKECNYADRWNAMGREWNDPG